MISTVMNGPAYPPGRVVAKKAHEYFSRHREQLRPPSRDEVASVASAETIEAVIDVAVWASLRREEGYIPRLSLAILAPEEAVQPLVFEEALPLTPGTLARVSPAVERPGLHVAVSRLYCCGGDPDVLRGVAGMGRRRIPCALRAVADVRPRGAAGLDIS